MNPRVALIQMVSSHHVSTNIDRLEPMLHEAAGRGVDAIFLPENFSALGAVDPRATGVAELDSSGPVRQFLSTIAAELGCWIFAGTLPVAARPDGTRIADGRVRAASLVFDNTGQEIARYDKMHMFDVDVDDSHRQYRESVIYEAGTELVSVDSPLGRVGLSVCYDIRFPELYRRLFFDAVDVLTIPSAFTSVTGEAHFKLLMRARAVENTCFTIAACQGGNHDSGRVTYGHSMVVDPWGDVIGELGLGEDILVCELDRQRQLKIRQEMPFRSQCRLVP